MQNIQSKHIYIIGIGGKGLNSVAEFCLSKGYIVSGSDSKESPETRTLIEKGASVTYIQNGEGLDTDIDIVVYSSIINEDHPERIRATELGIVCVSRAEFLDQITKDFIRISVAGSHGKSTTSALATLALKSVDGNVNAITGSFVKELQSYQSSGDSSYCVLEACEYAKSFIHIPGDYTLITALEKSHMEYFQTEEAMNDAFREFISIHKPDSKFIINGDVYKIRELCSAHAGPVITCGFNQSNDYVIRDVIYDEDKTIFSIYKDDECIEKDVTIHIPGDYNVLNVTLVFVLLHALSKPTDSFRKVLESFRGVGRRFEIYKKNEMVFVDDFAHHPTQVKNLIKGLKQFFPQKKILAVFEPRQFHLIKTFIKEYGKSFSLADEVCVTDIVPALGDKIEDIKSLSTTDVIESITRYSQTKKVWYAKTYQDVVQKLKTADLSNFVVATVGAGGVFQVRDLLINRVQ